MLYQINPAIFLAMLAFASLALLAMSIILIAKQKTDFIKIVYACEALKTEKELLRTRLELQDHTLAIMYEQIHDNIGQMLTAIHMKLHTLGSASEHKEETITALASGLGNSIRDLTNLGHAVDSAVIEKAGLIEALEHETTFFSSINHLPCIFTCTDELPELSVTEEIHLFRLIQEMMSFMLQYRSQNMTIHLEHYHRNIIVMILVAKSEKNIGGVYCDKIFQSIETRVKQFGGTLLLSNDDGTGQLLTLTYKTKQ